MYEKLIYKYKYKYIVFVVCIFIVYFIIKKMSNINEFFENKIIPLNIFTTWHTKDLQGNELLKKSNPEFNHYLYDENECRMFIKKYYQNDVLQAFDKLVPGAYKADLWRYCVLYIKGGIYVDIKYKCVNGFKFISLIEKEHFVRDRFNYGIYNALLVCKVGNEILFNLIKQIVHNTKTNFYGENSLHPTGPYLIKQFIDDETIDKLELFHKINNKNNNCIILKNKKILESYDNYRIEQKKFQLTEHYSILWNNKRIYNSE
jgi:mannosyltransferase OCH1-like enzyme